MSHELKKISQSEVEFTITVSPADYQKEMDSAAERLSERAAIKGFRPGKAPYDIVKSQVGEIKIMEEALEQIIQAGFYKAVQAEKLETVGMPLVTIEKMAPGNDIVYKAKVALFPKIKLADLSKIKIESKKIEVTQKQIEDIIESLKKMQIKETVKNETATKNDKAVINMDMFIDKVAVEGGQAKDHQIYLSEEHYIPGLAEQIIGLKKDDEKEFMLPFPKEHYQKHLAGKNVDFKVKIKDVFSLEYPEVNDEFAKKLGIESLSKLQELLKTNLSKEAEMKEEQRTEMDILEQLLTKSEYEEIPEILVKSEKQKMFHELKHDLEHRGISMEDYLKNIKKTEEQISDDFAEQAIKRVKALLATRQIALNNNIIATQEDIDKEIDLIKKTYADDPKVEENLKRADVLSTIATMIQNRKVMELLKSKVIK
ncbi:MAG: trigger factor [Candidatus Magasanikbacteria bacterium CG10_big_fil_rev_8_21_14_0_10_36_32]|uniref:Trigger factor n=1 Tax=Candidatus Magasanikbacteria bacterium CG10_big_fil_rev_8_21_14_0_10_36_32 TaxID=1974646 RepID=A0A2M6W716_9BACT|nr:MAG: trigger factor [Candidatus Magasanikbacteria bacterium CG10_big_fil_rev_8_21_14_0_10_36_32]